jgi:selenocysteine-specific elongation factor
MTLAPVATFQATRKADVQLRLLPSAPRSLKDRARVHFHSHTMEAVAELALHGTRQLSPGQEIFARLKLPEAALLLPGDRFIIRQFSPVVTIGGGVVLDAAPIPRAPGLDDFLKILQGGNREAILRARIARRHRQGISMSKLIAETGWTRKVIETQLATTVSSGAVVRWNDQFLHFPALEDLKSQLRTAVEAFHKQNPLAAGVGKEELRALLNATAGVFALALAKLQQEKKLEVEGDWVRLPGRGVVMKDEEAESKKRIEEAFAAAGLKVPALQEVLAGLKIDIARAQKIVTLLMRDKVLIKISDDLVFHRTTLEELRRQVAAYKKKSPKIDVAKFKELIGVTRKYAIPLLEYLDRERITKRVGDEREIL